MRGSSLWVLVVPIAAALAGGCASHYPAPGPVSIKAPSRPAGAKHPLPVRVLPQAPEGVGTLVITGAEAKQSAGQALAGLLGDVNHFLYVDDPKDFARYPYQLVVSVEFLDAQMEGRPVKRMGFDPKNPEQKPATPRRGSREQPTGETQDARYNFVSCRVLLMLQEVRGGGLPPRVVATGRGQANWEPSRTFLFFGSRKGTTTTPVIYNTIEQAVANALTDILSGEKLFEVDRTVIRASIAAESAFGDKQRLSGVGETPEEAGLDTP